MPKEITAECVLQAAPKCAGLPLATIFAKLPRVRSATYDDMRLQFEVDFDGLGRRFIDKRTMDRIGNNINISNRSAPGLATLVATIYNCLIAPSTPIPAPEYIVPVPPRAIARTPEAWQQELDDVIERLIPAPIADPVNHPPHYASNPDGIECIQVTRHMPFNIGNAVKYLWRAGKKGDAVEDLRKAVWYINDEIKRMETK